MIRFRFVSLLVAGALLSSVPVWADPSPRDLHAASCVAALEVLTEGLADEVKGGNEAARQVLLDRLVSGTAFVGEAYLRGLPEKDARDLANQALEAQKSLRPAELTARQAACADEGTKMYSGSNALNRAAVMHLAKRRMARLLGS